MPDMRVPSPVARVVEPRQVCVKCLKNRALRFFGPDARRTDGRSQSCVSCHRTKRSAGTRAQRILDTYGITEAEYAAIMLAQNGVCAICKGKRAYNLDLDHCHALERTAGTRASVRGCLCKQCNRRLLKAARDDISILRAAIEYLENPPARQVLSDR